jgi:hypothetical protein
VGRPRGEPRSDAGTVRVADDERRIDAEAIEDGPEVVRVDVGRQWLRRIAVSPDVVPDHRKPSGVARELRIPHAPVEESGVDQHDRDALSLPLVVEIAVGDGDAAGLGSTAHGRLTRWDDLTASSSARRRAGRKVGAESPSAPSTRDERTRRPGPTVHHRPNSADGSPSPRSVGGAPCKNRVSFCDEVAKL